MELLDYESPDKSERQQAVAKKYREKIIGKTCLVYAPSRYWEVGAIHDMGIEPENWKHYSIHARAELMARRYVKSMIEVVDAAYREEDESRRRAAADKKNKPPIEE